MLLSAGLSRKEMALEKKELFKRPECLEIKYTPLCCLNLHPNYFEEQFGDLRTNQNNNK